MASHKLITKALVGKLLPPESHIIPSTVENLRTPPPASGACPKKALCLHFRCLRFVHFLLPEHYIPTRGLKSLRNYARKVQNNAFRAGRELFSHSKGGVF